MLRGTYPGPAPLEEGIVASDCAGEVVAVGEGVETVKVGERVNVNFNWGGGDGDNQTVGGEGEGVLREWMVVEERWVVGLPRGLGWEEVGDSVLFGEERRGEEMVEDHADGEFVGCDAWVCCDYGVECVGCAGVV